MFLPEIISEFQSAFVPGRLITDNALVAYECLHTIRRQRTKKPYFAMKIDMMKAYDRVEWPYLRGCLSQLGFAPVWIDTVMKCVTQVRYAVRVNGCLTDPVIPTRGIRQGDPISPYLFLLCTEGLSCLLKKKEDDGTLKGLRNGRLGPSISHLLFADDSIFFARSDQRTVQALKSTLQLYCDGSGQKINFSKSSVFFGSHCPENIGDTVKAILEIENEALNKSYLGMPTDVGRSPVDIFKFLPERVWKSINGWTGRPISRAGKEVLLKACVQSIPTFVMSCFRIPVSTCERMRKFIADAWWGVEQGKKKMHWRSWDWLSSPKFLGGLGFRDLQLFNQAMLGKQGWRLLTNPDSFCARVLKGRYFPTTDFWHAPCPRSSSYTWRSILHGKKLLELGVLWRIGNGKSVQICRDRWVAEELLGLVSPVFPIPQRQTVDALINPETGQWDVHTITAFFHQDTAENILKIPICQTDCDDFASWPLTKSGTYSVKSAYNLARTSSFFCARSSNGSGSVSNSQYDEKHWKRLWAVKAPSKMKIILWRLAHDCLATGHQLHRRNVPANPLCCFCGRHERVEHCFIMCPFAFAVWEDVKRHFGIHLCRKELRNPKQWLFDLLDRCNEIQNVVVAVTCWHIWEARNEKRNSEVAVCHKTTVRKILAYVDMIAGHLLQPNQSTRCASPKEVQKWTPPPPGLVCINVDAAVFTASSSSAIGVVVRNHEGRCLMACRQSFRGITSPEVAEALALRRAVILAQEEGFSRAILRSDCLSLILKVNTSDRDRSCTGPVVADIKTIASSLTSVLFVHVSRSANEVAHLLARSSELAAPWTFRHGLPDCIQNIVNSESLLHE